jgi:AsmA protein
MARHIRRLIFWLLAGIAALALLAVLALAALWWLLDPNDFRSQIQARAGAAIGREVQLTGKLRWELGWQIFIVSEGGAVANAAGFGPEPLASWSQVRLGVAARPLLDRRVLIDRIDIEGLNLNLQRNAQGQDNWTLRLADADSTAPSQVTLRVGAVALGAADIRYRDAVSGADWHASELAFGARLPDDLAAADRVFRDIRLGGRLAGGPLAATGVRFALAAASIRATPDQLQVPAFEARWDDATLDGAVTARLGAMPDVTASLALRTPSLRATLATAGVTPPPMADPETLGALQAKFALRYAGGGAALTGLAMSLDDTRLSGELSLPHLDPVALRFSLDADRVLLDRYMEPDDVQSEPFELPLAQLKAMDAKGTLRIRSATIAGAVAKEVRIDVE